MSPKVKPALFVVSALIVAALTAVSAPNDRAVADGPTGDQALKHYQKAFLDAEAPAGTDITSHHAGMHDDPVATTATSPDTAGVLAALPSTAGGRWSVLKPLPSGFNAYHLVMGPGGKILLIAGSGNNGEVFKAGTFKAYIWSPTAGIIKTLKTPTDMFCSGHMLMSNGQGIAAGGTAAYSPWKGAKALYTFDFTTDTFKRQQDMAHGRWYPSLVNTPGGYSLITGGLDEKGVNSGTSELYSPTEASHQMVSGGQVSRSTRISS